MRCRRHADVRTARWGCCCWQRFAHAIAHAAPRPSAVSPLISEHALGSSASAAINCKRPVELAGGRGYQNRRGAPCNAKTTSRYADPGASTAAATASSRSRGNGAGPVVDRRRPAPRVPRPTARRSGRSERACSVAVGVRGPERCRLTSEAGFGLWLVQRSRAVLKECEFVDPADGGRRV